MLSEYVEGRLWSLADAHDPRSAVRLTERLQALHALAPPAGVRELDYAQLIARYRASLAARNDTGSRDRARLDGEADRRLAVLTSQPRRRRLCHNDVHRQNIVDGRVLTLIDWEYAAAGDGMFDLASFACYHDLDAAERAHLLASYAPGAANALVQPFDDCCWLFDYMHLLWLELSASDSALCQRLTQRLEVAVAQ